MALNIAVCIKQVPESMEVDMDPEKGLLLRGNAKKKINPYDLYALEAAARLKETAGGKLSAFTMGPLSAEEVLRAAAAFDADEGVLISDATFAGADVLATAKTLSDAIIYKGGFDVILFGRQTTDGDTGQVGAEVAATAGYPYIANAYKIMPDDEKIIFERRLTGKEQKGSVLYPAVISIAPGYYVPRIPSLKKKMAAKNMPVEIFDSGKLKNKENYGKEGSPTSVKRIYPVQKNREGKEIKFEGCEAYEYIISHVKTYTKLDEMKAIKGAQYG